MRRYKNFGTGLGLLALGFFIHIICNAPVANAAGPGCPDGATPGTGCVTLVVKLNPAPSSNATVTAKRQASHGADDSIALVATSPGVYKSPHPIAFSSVEACANGAGSPQNKYNITASGSATGSLGGINICNNESPKADGNDVKTVTVSVSTSGNPSSHGGISGILTITKPDGKTVNCGAGAAVNVSGPTDKTGAATTDSGGHFNTGLVLKPGTYQIVAECPTDGNPYHYKLTGIKVEAGKATDIGKTNSSGDGSSDAAARDACKKYAPGGSDADNTFYHDCLDGFADGAAGKSQDKSCGSGASPPYNEGTKSQKACLVGFNGFQKTQDDAGDDTSACVANSSTTLEWIGCPLITSMSKATELINDYIQSQLTFETQDFLPDSGGAHKAWSIIKTLITSMVVIIMLVMVISQAIGTGIFEAYTVKKVLPRLVIGVVAIQLSWELSIWLINLANDAGKGIIQIMAAPFGGGGNLDLTSLLNHMNGVWAGVVNWTLVGVLVAGAFLATVFLPTVALVAFLLFVAVAIAMATLLFRNVLIIACVIFAPLALLMWVLPGSFANNWWKKYIDNFTKLLVLFPLMVAIIYSGRIFAWIAGDLGAPGFLDLIMVLVGFFGPYFFLPQAFKWGGSWMAAGAKAIESNKAVNKGKELGVKEIRGWQKRKIDERAKALNADRETNPDYVKATKKIRRGPFKGMPLGYEGNLPKTLRQNLQAGRLMPTKRSLAVAINRGDQWSKEEDDIARAQINRQQDKAVGAGAKSYKLSKDGKTVEADDAVGTAAGKAAIWQSMGSPNDRVSGVALQAAAEKSSWVEWGSNLVPIEDEGLKQKIRASGAEVWENDPEGKGRIFVRAFDVPRYVPKFNTGDLYGMPMQKWTVSTPHIADSTIREDTGLTASQFAAMEPEEKTEWMAARKEGRPSKVKPMPHSMARIINTIDGGYLDAGNILNQSESEIGEIARLAQLEVETLKTHRVADEFAGLLDRIAQGGQGGANVLGNIMSNSSAIESYNKVLKNATKGPNNVQAYRDHALRVATGQEAPDAGGGQQTMGDQQPAQTQQTQQTQQTGSTQQQTQGGGTGASSGSGGGAGGGQQNTTTPQTQNAGMSTEAAARMSRAVEEGTKRAILATRGIDTGGMRTVQSGDREVTINLRPGERINPTQPAGQAVIPPGVRSVDEPPTNPPA